MTAEQQRQPSEAARSAEASPEFTDTAVAVTAAAVAATVMAGPAVAAIAVGGLAGVGAAHVARRLGVPVDAATAAAAKHTANTAQAAARLPGRFMAAASAVVRDLLDDEDAVYVDDDPSEAPRGGAVDDGVAAQPEELLEPLSESQSS